MGHGAFFETRHPMLGIAIRHSCCATVYDRIAQNVYFRGQNEFNQGRIHGGIAGGFHRPPKKNFYWLF